MAKPTIGLSARIDPQLYEDFSKLAEARGLSVSAAVVAAVGQWISEELKATRKAS